VPTESLKAAGVKIGAYGDQLPLACSPRTDTGLANDCRKPRDSTGRKLLFVEFGGINYAMITREEIQERLA
jgi:hypothetical protein